MKGRADRSHSTRRMDDVSCVFDFLHHLSWPTQLRSCCLITTLTSTADSAFRRVAAGMRLHFNVFISYANMDPVEPVIIHREPSLNGNDSVLLIYYSWPQTGQAVRGFWQNLVRGRCLAAVYLHTAHLSPTLLH